MHYVKPGNADSIIKGYWSGNEYRGKSYKTYQTDAVSKFDRVEVSPTSESGNRINLAVRKVQMARALKRIGLSRYPSEPGLWRE